MNEEPVSDTLLRQFLLGQVDDQQRQRLESMFVTGALSNERVMAAEQHLLDDYLDDLLTSADRERFLAQYGETPVEQRKLRIAKSIQQWAVSSSEVAVVGAAAGSRLSRLLRRFRLKPVFMIPIAAVSVIAIVFAVISLKSRWDHRAMEQELARLNAPSMFRETSASVPPLRLAPGSVRSTETENELTPPVNAEFVELNLLWTQKESFPTYQATIRRYESGEKFAVPPLYLDNASNMIRLRLPTRFLTRGLYQIEVSGVAANGVTGPAEEYTFVVPK